MGYRSTSRVASAYNEAFPREQLPHAEFDHLGTDDDGVDAAGSIERARERLA
jgi:hypothetical protein